MAPPTRKSGMGLETRDPLAAIVLADSFTQRLRPVTLECPKVLLPLVNTPMLDYTLEWLAINEVEEVYVFICAHAEAVLDHLESAGWASDRKFKLHAVVSTNCLSVGDALRVMDGHDTVKSDFILVAGDVISNMKLAPAVAAHKARRAADKNAIMTMVMRGGLSPAHIRRLGDTPTVAVIDSDTQRLLKFEDREDSGGDATTPSRRRRRFFLDTHAFSERDSIVVRSDMAEASIYICAPEVLLLFSDNFDYQNVRRDFVSGVLSEEELGNKLYVHELTDEYCARVHNLRSYDAVSRDVIQRWAYPLCPDVNLWAGSTYKYLRGNTYVDRDVRVARSARLLHGCCIGSGTVIGEGAVLESSVVGPGCVVGPNCHLQGAYLAAGVVLGRDVHVRFALLCVGCVVKDGAQVEPGAVLSHRVVVDAGHVVPGGARVSLFRPPAAAGGDGSEDDVEAPTREATAADFEDEEDEAEVLGSLPPPSLVAAAAALAGGSIPETNVEFDSGVVGPLGAGFLWPTGSFDAERCSLVPAPAADDRRGTGDSSDDETGSATGEVGTGEAEAGVSGTGVGGNHFKREVGETFLRCVKEHISHENIVIELNGLKIAEDKTFADCARYMLTTMLGLCLPTPPATRAEYRELYTAPTPEPGNRVYLLDLLKRAILQLQRWKDLLQKFLRNEDDQVELLLTLEEFCSDEGDFEGTGEHGSVLAGIFAQLLKALYDEDIITENAILQWAQEKSLAEEDEKVFLRKAQTFLDWLQEAEEESDDSEDDSDDE